ncbi:lipopolysaccharide biosynthesis protein [Bacteroides clarus]|mgnify:CR=1 FL=1|uniref:lipopolysaccharide biosynthesis protein n=1 Tax=Bacteroides clarus TaxID=626929 RepID=UPI0024B1CE56|nr:lipopolysaccharide biosynthesis protein [Bacteroides clarus]
MSNSENTKRVAKNTFFLFFRMIIVMCVGLYTSRVVLKILGVEDYGVYNVIGSVVILFSFLQSALTNATYRFLAYDLGVNDRERLRKTFSMSVNTHWILAVIIFILSETIGLWFLNTKIVLPEGRLYAANWAYQFAILSFVVNIIRTPYHSSIIAREQMNFFAYTSIIEVLLKLGTLYLLVYLSFDKLILYSCLVFGVGLFIFLWYYWYCKQKFPECNYHFCWEPTLLAKMIKYSGWSLLVNAVEIGATQAIVIFFNIFVGVVANAALGIANGVNGQLNAFLHSFTQSFDPQIIKTYAKGDRGYFLNLIYSTSKISYYLLFLVSIPVLLNIDFILYLWLGEVPSDTSLFIYFVLLYSFIDAYSAPLWISVYATGNLKNHQLLMSAITLFNIPLAYLLLKAGCDAWTALALKAILNFVCSIARPIYMVHLIKLPLQEYFIKVFFRIFIVTAITLPLPIYVAIHMNEGWTKLFSTTGLFVFVSGITVLLLGLTKSERCVLYSLIKRKKNM